MNTPSDTTDCALDNFVKWCETHWRSMLYSFLAGVLFTVGCTFCSAAQAASYSKPVGAVELFVPAHGVTVGVWATQTGIGHGIGVFEKSGAGDWVLCGQCIIDPAYPSLDGAVANAGGPGPYVASKLAAVNALLASRYPSVMPEPTTTLEKVNQSLGSYTLRLVNGSPVLGVR